MAKEMRTFKVVKKQPDKENVILNLNQEDILQTPVSAALKAFNQLCRVKKIRGVCTSTVTVQETTRGSDGKILHTN